MIEDDWLGFLATRYRDANNSRLATILEAWVGVPGAMFGNLASTNQKALSSCFDDEDRRQILTDLVELTDAAISRARP